MTTSPDYLAATNAAYEVLSQYEYFSLPIFLRGIIKKYPNIRVLTYTEAELKYGLHLDVLMERSCHGFTMVRKCKHIILFNEKKDSQIVRFTLAHELGHCVLGHIIDDEVSDKEANCFARNILCPIPIIKELHLNTVEDYMNIFAVSEPMASASMDLADYDSNLINQNLYSKIHTLFTCHRLEKYSPADSLISHLGERDVRTYTYIASKRSKTLSSYSRRNNLYVTEEEKELLDYLKFGE